MNFEAKSRRAGAIWELLTILFFLGLIWLPTLDHFFKLDHARMPNENRLPAVWPKFKGIGQSRDFITGVENYFNDHFGFRKRLIRWNNHWKHQLFRTSTLKEVLVGREGWLFYTGAQMLEHWTRQAAWTEQDLQNWRRLLELRRDWLHQRGIKYLFIVPPDKHTVYPEYLPDWMVKSSKPAKLQQLADYMKTHSTVEFIDLTQSLIDAKKIRVDYLKTDTHWNNFGAFVAYQTLAQALTRQFPELQPLPADTYDWKPAPQPRGDSAILLGSDSAVETMGFTYVPLRPLPLLKVIFDPIRLPHQGTKETRPCYTRNEQASGKAMVFHDSFARSWLQFLGQHFKEVIYVWQYNWDCALIERERPNIVIDETIERFFNLEDPVEMVRKDRIPETTVAHATP
jgi:hypothetical protein